MLHYNHAERLFLREILKPARSLKRLKKSDCYPLFSDQDEDLRQLRWFVDSKGYPATNIKFQPQKKRVVMAHTIVKIRSFSDDVLDAMSADHINRNKMDSSRENLRMVTHAQNMRNKSSAYYDESSSLFGVAKHKQTGKFQAVYKLKYIGLFNSSMDAHNAVLDFKKTLTQNPNDNRIE